MLAAQIAQRLGQLAVSEFDEQSTKNTQAAEFRRVAEQELKQMTVHGQTLAKLEEQMQAIRDKFKDERVIRVRNELVSLSEQHASL